MCGIAGIVSSESNLQVIEEMLSAQSHRGPDNSQTYQDSEYAYFGHNRLSIIDLQACSNQPFIDNSGRYVLTFNGEIYNYLELKEDLKEFYQFQTNSDTEVLLAAYIIYGKQCLDKFNGMFSFAIWDTEEKTLFAARDRFGVKPFYYTQSASSFIFASEIKSLQIVTKSKQPNLKVWANYFAYGSYGLPSETFYQGINQLPGGFYLEYKQGDLKIDRWYDFVENVKSIEPLSDLREIKSRYLDLLKDSIKLRFRADVPIGFNLSGGVDSSLLLALVNNFETKKNIEAFTFYCGDERYDELTWVNQMISLYKNQLNEVKLSSAEVPELATRISDFQDEPYGGIPTLAYSKIFEKAQAKGVKVMLDGQGMDEQWAGYDYYFQNSGNNIQGLKAKSSPFKLKCISGDLLNHSEKINYPMPFNNKLQNLQYRDLFYTKIPRALRFNDRVSMANNTELREPFLDYRLVEFAFSLPDEYKINGNTQKFLLREIIKEFLPFDVVSAPKRPLQTPQREWLSEDLQIWTENELQNLEKSEFASWFEFDQIWKEWQLFTEGDISSSFHIWQWINLSILIQQGKIAKEIIE